MKRRHYHTRYHLYERDNHCLARIDHPFLLGDASPSCMMRETDLLSKPTFFSTLLRGVKRVEIRKLLLVETRQSQSNFSMLGDEVCLEVSKNLGELDRSDCGLISPFCFESLIGLH